MSASLRRLLLVTALASSSLACAGHSKKTLQARAALDAGQPGQALALYNEELGVKSGDQLPDDTRGDRSLLVLDRSMIQQQLSRYPDSSRDLELADKQIEMLDLQKTALDSIGKYMFSDDVGPYQAPPYEKLLINTMNMVNYILRHDLGGAKVEARRFSILRKYLDDSEAASASMSAPGSYLAGFAFEKSGRPDIALQYYEEALEYGDFKSLIEPLSRLTQGTTIRSQRVREFLEKYGQPVAAAEGVATATPPEDAAASNAATPANAAAPTSGVEPAAPDAPLAPPPSPAELLVVINYGRVPAKIPKRVPIGLALTYGAVFLSPGQTATANEIAAQGLVTWVNYPELEETNRKYETPSVKVDGKYATLEAALAVDVETKKAYEKDKGAIMAAAIVRMITRFAAGQGARAAAQGASNDALVGAIASIATQATLAAADTPDTRSWATLPGRIAVARIPLPPGKHRIELKSQGASQTFDIELAPGGWEAVGLTVLR